MLVFGVCCLPDSGPPPLNALPLLGYRFGTKLSVNFLFQSCSRVFFIIHITIFFCSHCLSANQFILDNLI